MQLAGIVFQACSFSARTSVPVNASCPQRLGARDGRVHNLKSANSARNVTVQETAAHRQNERTPYANSAFHTTSLRQVERVDQCTHVAQSRLFPRGAETKIGAKPEVVAPGEPTTPANLLKTKKLMLAERVSLSGIRTRVQGRPQQSKHPDKH